MSALSEALKGVWEVATCPICFERLTGSTFCCLRGHAVCDLCRPRLHQCPTCNRPFNAEKQITLSKILEALPFPCRFPECPALPRDKKEHESWCGSRRTSCLKCEWTGRAKDLYNHCKDKHLLLVDSEHPGTMRMLLNDSQGIHKTYIKYYQGQFLWMKLAVERNTRSLSFVWVPDGSVEKEMYEIKVRIVSDEAKFEMMIPIRRDLDNDTNEKNKLTFQNETLKSFADDGQFVVFRFTISKKS